MLDKMTKKNIVPSAILLEDEGCKMDDGQWRMKDKEWMMENVGWRMEDERLTLDVKRIQMSLCSLEFVKLLGKEFVAE